MPILDTKLYSPEAPFADGIGHPLASESGIATMLYGACRSLGRIASSVTPEEFIDDMSRGAYSNNGWQPKEIGEFLATLGVNFLSFNVRQLGDTVDDLLAAGKLNNPAVSELVSEILENTKGNKLPRLSRKLHLALGGRILWGMEAGVNGYNKQARPADRHYLGFLDYMPGIGSHLWDTDIRPHDDVLGLRPKDMFTHEQPGTYVFRNDWIDRHANGDVIVVWTDEARQETQRKLQDSMQLDVDVQIDSRNMLLNETLTPVYPTKNTEGYGMRLLGESTVIYTYGENIKSQDGESALACFANKIGTDKLVLPNMGGHTARVLCIDGSEVRDKEGCVAMHPLSTEECDGLLVIDPKWPICIPGADCPMYVGSGLLQDGRRFIFGAHSGQIGMLRGLNESMVAAIQELDVVKGSVEVLIGPAAHTIELDLEYIATYDEGLHNWQKAIVRRYADDGGVERVILNVALSVSQTLSKLGDLLSIPPSVVMSNTLADHNVWSERGQAMHGELPSKSNAVVVFP